MTSQSGNGSSTLVLIVHGWRSNPAKMEEVKQLVEAQFGASAKILVPRLPHAATFSFIRVAVITKQLIELIDQEAALAESEGRPFDKIILMGHSMGATIARRVYLVARNLPKDFRNEAPLDHIAERAWAKKVDRIVMLAAISRGWQVSGRLSWSYAIIFNVMGAAGHLLAMRDWVPSIFDIRLGAPFMVQTRLHWLAHRRATARTSQEDEAPLVIQLIGTQDDLVSPLDQVDIAVDAAFSDNSSGQRYFYIELPYTDHNTAVIVNESARRGRHLGWPRKANSGVAGCRAKKIREALASDASRLKKIETNFALLLDQIPPIDKDVRSVVFVIHGIRDDGFWTHRIAERVKEEQKIAIYKSWTPSYGYFAIAPFLLPWVRRLKVEWLMDQFVTVRALYPNAREFDYVGHSNGTFLAAHALPAYPAFKLRRIYFAGSVVRSDYDWASLIQDGRVETFLNVRASADWVVALFPKSLAWIKSGELGGAGFDGFEQAGKLPEIQQLSGYVAGGHGAGVKEDFWDLVSDFISTGNVTPPDKGIVNEPAKWLSLLSRTYLGLPAAIASIVGVAIAILWPLLTHIGHFDMLDAPTALKVAVGFAVYALVVTFVLMRV